jgi:hypothetical protein
MPSTAGVSHYQMRLEAVEQEVLREALQAHNGDKRAAARALGSRSFHFIREVEEVPPLMRSSPRSRAPCCIGPCVLRLFSE